MVTRLDDPPVINDDNLVGIPDCAQAVGNYDNGLAPVELVEIFHDSPFVVRIKRVGGFIKEDEVGILIHGTGNEYTLLLSLTQPYAVAACLSIVFQRKRHHIVVYTSYLCGLQEPLLVYVTIVDSDVAGDALREYNPVLHDHPALSAPPFLLSVLMSAPPMLICPSNTG